MNSAIERLLQLRVRDVMQRRVISIPEYATMTSAAAVLLQNHISGAPVIDGAGRCVGVLSTTDFARRELEQFGEAENCCGSDGRVARGRHGALTIEEVDTTRVAAHMSVGVQSVGQEASLLEAARIMCGAHIHRLPVTDLQGRPQGMVSSLDLVAAMVAAVEE